MGALDPMSLDERRARSALVVVVPTPAEPVEAYARRYTRAGASVPPHVTLMHPFLAPNEVTAAVRRRICLAVEAVPAFPYALTGVAEFPGGVVYLTPEPAAPFVALIARLRQAFPEVRPFWDAYDAVVPHVTVADLALADRAGLRDEIETAVAPHLPLRRLAREAVLLQRVRPAPAPWDVRGRFAFGPSGAVADPG